MTSAFETGLSWVAVAAQTAFFVQIVAASFTHFKASRITPGFAMIAVATPGATLAFLALWALGPAAPTVASAAALALNVIATLIFRRAMRETRGQNLDVVFAGSQPGALITHGLYARIRNPFYTSYMAYWAAWIPMLGWAWPPILVFGFFALAYATAAVSEERALLAAHGDAYAAYVARTRRFL